MSTINRFEDLRIWQQARDLCKTIFKLSTNEKFSQDYSLKDQIRRSSGSAMDNIAEGYGRDGNKEFKNFLAIAKGSLVEVKSQLYRALDYNYITEKEFRKTYTDCDNIIAGVSKLMYYFKDSKFKGPKFER